jgi:hypothetical protein
LAAQQCHAVWGTAQQERKFRALGWKYWQAAGSNTGSNARQQV